jgi:hypothetical protein
LHKCIKFDGTVEQVATLYHHLSETIPQMSRKDWSRVSGQLFADFGIAKRIGKSLHLAKNTQVSDIIKENPLIAKVRTKLEEALLNPEMVTPESIVLKGVQTTEEMGAAEKSLVQAMSAEQKGLKESSKNIGQKIIQEQKPVE